MSTPNPRMATTREEFWDRALEGDIHILDPEFTDYPDMPSLRAAAYREATARDLKVVTSLVDDRHLVVAAYGGPGSLRARSKEEFKALLAHMKGDPYRDTTMRMVDQQPERYVEALGAADTLPEIAPDSPLFTDPGAFWVGRTWLPVRQWHCPFGPDRPNPLQCTWFPYHEFWELGDLSLLQDRREAGTLFPWEQRRTFMPPGTELAEADGWVWQPDDWLELASERAYCSCPMRLDNTLVSPNRRRDYPFGCAYWTAPPAAEDLEAISRFLDPRAGRVPGLMDDAEIRMKVLEAERKAPTGKVAMDGDKTSRTSKRREDLAVAGLKQLGVRFA